MKSLFQFLWRHNFTISFLLLFSVSLYLVILNNRFQQVAVLNSSNRMVASAMELVNSFSEFISLKDANQILARENAFLKSNLMSSYMALSVIDTTVNDSTFFQQYKFTAARVVNNSVNRRNNYITLDKGRIHGIKPDMGVISDAGVVGIVKDVSDHFCTVMSVLHKNSKISTRFKESSYFGSLVWDGLNYRTASLLEIAKHVEFKTGDTLVTTYFSTIFPEGIRVGTVGDFKLDPEDNFYEIDVRLSVDFARLSHVYIVSNILKDEQRKLEELTQKADDK